MSKINWPDSIKNLLKYPWFTVPITAIIFAIILYFSNNIEMDTFLIVIILAFLMSDFLTWGLVSEGHGIFQFSSIGTKTQSKGYAFIIFFALIIFVAYVANLITLAITILVPSLYSNFITVLAICLMLSVLVYLDMYIRFFVRKKRKKRDFS
jgi:uncharacterized membrane protein